MSDKTIDEVTPDTNVTGVEKMPVSDNGTAKSVTIEKVKDFVLAKINALEAASDISVASDGVFIKKDGAMKPLSAETLASAVVSYAFGSDTAASLAGTDVVVLSKNGVTKKTTLSDLTDYFKEAIVFDSWHIGELPDPTEQTPVTRNTYLAIENYGNESVNCRVEMDQFASAVFYNIIYYVTDSVLDVSEDTDSILFLRRSGSGANTHYTLTSSSPSKFPFGTGNVTGPANGVTGEEIAQFNGTTGRVLKGSKKIVTTVGSAANASDEKVPTEKAVRLAISSQGNVVTGPFTTTSSKVPVWSNDSRDLSDGLSVETTSPASPSDTQLMTAKAIVAAIKGAVEMHVSAPTSGATGYSSGQMVYCTATGSEGLYVNVGTSQSASWSRLSIYVANQATGPASTTAGNVPYWGSDNLKLTDGFSVQTVMPDSASNTQLMTAHAIKRAINGAVTVVSTVPIASVTGFEQGQMLYCTDVSAEGLYINVGSVSSASWKRLAPDQ